MHHMLFPSWINGWNCWLSWRYCFNTTLFIDGNVNRSSARDQPLYCIDIYNISCRSILLYRRGKYTLCNLNWLVLNHFTLFRHQVYKENYPDNEKKVIYKLRTFFRPVLLCGNLTVEIHCELNYLSK